MAAEYSNDICINCSHKRRLHIPKCWNSECSCLNFDPGEGAKDDYPWNYDSLSTSDVRTLLEVLVADVKALKERVDDVAQI